MRPTLVPRGVIPANLLPFDASLEIDEGNYRRHIRHLASIEGVTAITTNAHASEVATLTAQEQQRVLELTVDELGGKLPVVCGVYEDGSAKAARIARAAERDGADALLIFPSVVFAHGSQSRPEIAYAHYATIAEATSLPMIAFVYPAGTGLTIQTDALVRICSEIDNVVAIKEWSNDITIYERNYRALKELDKEVSVLTSFSKALLASLCVGADGILSGHGSVIAELHVEIFDAVARGDLEAARSIADRIFPLVEVFYAEPFLDGHNRMKEALAILGRIDEARVRPPLRPISDAERERIRRAVTDAALHREAVA
jgi:4-hydroxy-tetrahydrodipicolinate synthase